MKQMLRGVRLVAVLSGLVILLVLPGAARPNVAQEPGSLPEAKSPDQGSQAQKPQPDAQGIYVVGNGVTAPKPTYTPSPPYTDQARKKKISGGCVVALVVDAQGNPQNAHITRSIAEGLPPKLKKASEGLDQNAVTALMQYRFEPAEYQGKPVPVRVKVEVHFAMY